MLIHPWNGKAKFYQSGLDRISFGNKEADSAYSL